MRGPKRCSREWGSLGCLITLLYGHGALRSSLSCAYCKRPSWDLETRAPQHVWCPCHMKHQPRGFASYVGAPQHIWCPYDRLHQPRGFASCLKSKLAAAAWIYTHPDLRLRNHGVPSFFLIIKSFIRPAGPPFSWGPLFLFNH